MNLESLLSSLQMIFVRWQDEEGEWDHEGHECNAHVIVHASGISTSVVVEGEGKQPSKDASKVIEASKDTGVGIIAD